MEEIFKAVAQVGGIGGVALLVFFYLFKRIKLGEATPRHLTLFMWLTWSVAVLGVASYNFMHYIENKSDDDNTDDPPVYTDDHSQKRDKPIVGNQYEQLLEEPVEKQQEKIESQPLKTTYEALAEAPLSELTVTAKLMMALANGDVEALDKMISSDAWRDSYLTVGMHSMSPIEMSMLSPNAKGLGKSLQYLYEKKLIDVESMERVVSVSPVMTEAFNKLVKMPIEEDHKTLRYTIKKEKHAEAVELCQHYEDKLSLFKEEAGRQALVLKKELKIVTKRLPEDFFERDQALKQYQYVLSRDELYCHAFKVKDDLIRADVKKRGIESWRLLSEEYKDLSHELNEKYDPIADTVCDAFDIEKLSWEESIRPKKQAYRKKSVAALTNYLPQDELESDSKLSLWKNKLIVGCKPNELVGVMAERDKRWPGLYSNIVYTRTDASLRQKAYLYQNDYAIAFFQNIPASQKKEHLRFTTSDGATHRFGLYKPAAYQ